MGRSFAGRARSALTAVVGGFAIAAAAGAVYQFLASWNERRRHFPPGRLVDVGGHRLHVRDEGEGSPVVVLESGLTATSACWGWVRPTLAAVTRVVSYDRAGIGWSDASSGRHDGVAVAVDLAVLLSRIGVEGPLVLAGHSMGGLFLRVFADLHRERVAGMVLVDPAHPDQLERFPAEGVELQRDLLGHLRVAPILAELGVLRLTGGRRGTGEGLPKESLTDVEVFFSSPHHWRGVKAEMVAWDATAAEVRRTGPLGDLPLLVLSASGPPGEILTSLRLLHEDLAGLSSRGQHRVVPDSDHYTILTNRTPAAVTAAAILEVVEEVRRKRGVAAQEPAVA
jgi:pimeloyl-ACP methyl ester carboxylesterase